MADLSLTDALTDSVPDVEDVVERDFVATLEAETFDDQVGETIGKTDFIPLLDNDGKDPGTVVENGDQKVQGAQNPGAVSGKLDSSGLILASWPETQGDVQTHHTDQQAFETNLITGSVSGFSQSSPPRMMDSSLLEPFSGLSEPSVMPLLNTGGSDVPLQTEKSSKPQESSVATEVSKIPAEPLLSMTPKSPLDTSAGVFGERWSDEAGIPSDLPFTPSVSTVISRHASHLADSPHDTLDPQWSPRDTGPADEREGEGSDRKKDKKKKKRRPRDDVYDFHTELQSESASSESPHHSSPCKERDRDGGWEDVGRVGGRVKKPKSRKKIPEEWSIHAEPFVPASASMSQEFGNDFTSTSLGVDSSLISLSEDYTDESLIPLSLTQDLLSLTAASPTSTLPLPKTSGQPPSSISSGFDEIIMETDSSTFQDYPKDAFDLPSPLGKAGPLACGINETQSFMSAEGSFEEAVFDQEHPYTGSLESPLKEPQMSTPASTCFVPPMETLISAPPFSPSGPAWSINNHNQPFNLAGMEGVAFETQVPKQNKSPKESKAKQGRKSCSLSSKSPTTPDAKLPSPQNSGLNPAAPPFFPSFVEPLEHVEGTVFTLEGLWKWIHVMHGSVDSRPGLE